VEVREFPVLRKSRENGRFTWYGVDLRSILSVEVQMIPVLLLLIGEILSTGQEGYTEARRRMVEEQIVARGIRDATTLDALRSVPRHEFVSQSARGQAYDDRPLPIGYGQTISQPYIVAYMTELVRPRNGEKILEIGTGSGYQAAILAGIVDSVFTVEIITELADEASHRLRSLGYHNVFVKNGDGYYGWSEHAPFDAVVVTAAAEHIPPPLIDQLKDDGIMVIPVGSPFFVQVLMRVEKHGDEYTTESLMPVRFVPFTRGK
jgi:protein-L-isoaspartate(D-aspartate) O-methyltransferase